jgi:hypothetical protein
VAATILFQQVFHVLKKLEMATLVTCNSNAICIFFYRTFYNFMHAPVVAKMNYLSAFALHNPPHNIDGSIVPVK